MTFTLNYKNKLLRQIKLGSIVSKLLSFKRYFLLTIDINKYLLI